MKTVVVIGAGASGLTAAIFAAKSGNKVILLERNSMPAKKILITGNGRCNYFNEDQNLIHYHSSNNKIKEEIITPLNIESIKSFFTSIGLVPKIKNGYYYPYSNNASSVKEALINEAILNNVEIITNAYVTDIQKKEKFIIKFNDKYISADKLIVSTGSKAAPKTGSDGNGFELLKDFDFNIIKPRPALVQLKGTENYFKNWDGVRAEAIITLYENDQKLRIETGEIQLTNYGVSGICIFNLSGMAIRSLDDYKKVYLKINFLPFIKSESYLIEYMENRNRLLNKRTIKQLLDSILNYKLVNVILNKSKIKDETWDSLDKNQKKLLAQNLINFELEITGYNDFDKAQVTSGGIDLKGINFETMESKVEDLYLTGEILDVDGDCGGYNLTFAFITGMLAGKGIQIDKSKTSKNKY